MLPVTPERSITKRPRPRAIKLQGRLLFVSSLMGFALVSTLMIGQWFGGDRALRDPAWEVTPAPLVMKGGDPYIRALMRTISAAESNSVRPYSILYGGEHVDDLSQHPDKCITIVTGPNTGNCTTAAGRYQFIITTWQEKAKRYHPDPDGMLFWKTYSFEPVYQDEVVYAWLNDPDAWDVDLAQLLRNGELSEVLKILSPTWTSLGYGIESNSMTDELPEIYQRMLNDELKMAIGVD